MVSLSIGTMLDLASTQVVASGLHAFELRAKHELHITVVLERRVKPT